MLSGKQGERDVAWTFEEALKDDDVKIVERNDAWGLYSFTVGTLKTEITIKLCRSPVSEETRFERSHDIQTPAQASPYHGSRLFWDSPAYALHQAISGITEFYREGIENHKPDESWLVANDFTDI
jgi:hypothetical protein